MDLNVTPGADGITRVAVRGDVSQADFVPADEPLTRQLGEDDCRGTVLVDLSGVTTLDSSGVGWLLLCQKKVRTAGGRLVLHSLSPFVQQLFGVLKMHLALTVVADEAAAIEIARQEQT
jgi:anti-anti-sigma factor